MKQFFVRLFKVFVIIAAFVVLYLNLRIPETEKNDECGFKTEYGRKLFPEMTDFRKINDKCCYEVLGNTGKILGKILYVKPDETVSSGYGGQFRIVVGINNDDKISGVDMGENHETPGFTEMIRSQGFFSQWNGLDLTNAAEKSVDTVTGATLSTSCIKCMVKKNISDYLGTKAETGETGRYSYVFYISLLLLIYSVVSFFMPGATAKFRIYHMLMIVIFLGFLGGYALSIETFKNLVVTGHAAIFTIILFVFAMIMPLFTGKNFYCSYVCPMGALQELAGKVPLKKLSIPVKVLKIMTILRKLLLLSIFILLFFRIVEDYTRFEPFSAFQFRGAGIASLIIAGVTVVISFFIAKPWCRFFCPTGMIFNIIVEKHKTLKRPGNS